MPWALRQAAFTGRSLDLKQSQPLLHTDIARLKLGKVGAQVRAPLLQRQRAVSRVVFCSSGACGSRRHSTTRRRSRSLWNKSAACGSCSSSTRLFLRITLHSHSLWPPPFRYPDTFKVCLSAADVDAAAASVPPKIASLIGMEGGHSIGGSIETLAAMYETVTHAHSIPILFHSIDYVASFSLR